MKMIKFLLSYIALVMIGGGLIYVPFNLVTGEINIYAWDTFYKVFWLILVIVYMTYLLGVVFSYYYPDNNSSESDVVKTEQPVKKDELLKS